MTLSNIRFSGVRYCTIGPSEIKCYVDRKGAADDISFNGKELTDVPPAASQAARKFSELDMSNVSANPDDGRLDKAVNLMQDIAAHLRGRYPQMAMFLSPVLNGCGQGYGPSLDGECGPSLNWYGPEVKDLIQQNP